MPLRRLFFSDSHAAEIMNLLKKTGLNACLFWALAMVDRITSRLKLPSPELYLNIEVWLPHEIQQRQK